MEKLSGSSARYYFAAMNTASGFCGKFKEIFGDTDKLFIIKGGPGTGKSRFMAALGAEAEARNRSVEYFYCSSDTTSLDGVIFTSKNGNERIGVIDGTAPHTYDPILPGAKDNILNFCDFWNSEMISRHKTELLSLNKAKQRLFSSVYGYLAAIRELDKITSDITVQALDKNKMTSAIRRILHNISFGKGYKERVRIRSAIGSNGIVRLDTFSKIANANYAVIDREFAANSFMNMLKSELIRLDQPITVSYDPFFPDTPDAIYVPDADMSFYIGSECKAYEKTVNTARFIDIAKISEYRPKLRAVSKLRKQLLEMVYKDNSEIRILHSSAEEIYISAMDFSRNDSLRNKLISELFT